MEVQILSYTSGSEEVLATITVDADGEPVIDGDLPPRIRRELMEAHKRANSDGPAFLRSLPTVFSGTYIRARLKKG